MKIKLKKRTCCLLAVMLAAVLLLLSCAPARETQLNPQIDPRPESVSKEGATTKLYFGYLNNRLLVGENRSFEVPVNENPEKAIIEQLIDPGSSPSKVDFVQLINPATKVVNVTSEGEFLFVTLSREFIQPFRRDLGAMGEDGAETDRRYLAVYSIVNTVVEQGAYSRVSILIDEDGTGNGRPVTNAEAGLFAEGEPQAEDQAEAFERKGDIVLTPKNTMREILNATEKNEWGALYEYIAYKDSFGEDKPSTEEFRNELSTAKFSVSNYEVLEDVVSQDGTADAVFVNYDLKLQGGELNTKTNIPVRLILENDVWKITYNVYKTKFMS